MRIQVDWQKKESSMRWMWFLFGRGMYSIRNWMCLWTLAAILSPVSPMCVCVCVPCLCSLLHSDVYVEVDDKFPHRTPCSQKKTVF